jgi:integrase
MPATCGGSSARTRPLPPSTWRRRGATSNSGFRGRTARTPTEQKRLWDGLSLTGPELVDLLAHLEGVTLEPFVRPLFGSAVCTGVRRSEMLRTHTDDFDFKGGCVQIHEKKRVGGKSSVRWVDLHPGLGEIMKAWFAAHSGGQHTLAQPDGPPVNIDLMDHRLGAAVRCAAANSCPSARSSSTPAGCASVN